MLGQVDSNRDSQACGIMRLVDESGFFSHVSTPRARSFASSLTFLLQRHIADLHDRIAFALELHVEELLCTVLHVCSCMVSAKRPRARA
jgi:hypothetical protein